MKDKQRITKERFFQSGFTLLEIMIVVVIIGVIASFAIVNLMNASEGAKIKLASGFVKGSLKSQISLYQLNCNAYPNSLNDLVTKPSDANGWRGPYLDEYPKDPWGEPYQYKYPGTHNPNSFDVYSKGPDKVDGTADDIGNWSDTPAP
jgi:general secretion pathway protein G